MFVTIICYCGKIPLLLHDSITTVINHIISIQDFIEILKRSLEISLTVLREYILSTICPVMFITMSNIPRTLDDRGEDIVFTCCRRGKILS